MREHATELSKFGSRQGDQVVHDAQTKFATMCTWAEAADRNARDRTGSEFSIGITARPGSALPRRRHSSERAQGTTLARATCFRPLVAERTELSLDRDLHEIIPFPVAMLLLPALTLEKYMRGCGIRFPHLLAICSFAGLVGFMRVQTMGSAPGDYEGTGDEAWAQKLSRA